MPSLRRIALLLSIASLASLSQNCLAHGTAGHGQTSAAPLVLEQKPWGIAAEAKQARRSISVTMSDKMRFSPERIMVKQGETVRLLIRNEGVLLHEFVLGTRTELDKHAELMQKFPDMAHEEPYMTHVAPGQTGEIVWTFNRAGEFDFACLIAGHYQAGMVGKVIVNPRQRSKQDEAHKH